MRAARISLVLLLTLLSATAIAAELTRGPYLQLSTSDSIVVRWRTDVATDSRVFCGPAPGALSLCAEDLTATTEHEIPLTSLLADTHYYYAIGSSTETLAGDDADHHFYTHPAIGTSDPMRIWVLGDSGFGSQEQADVRDAYLAYTGSTYTDLWLHVGDVSQSTGTDEQYQTEFFDMYPTMLPRTAVWPTHGNHDTANSDSATQTGPYYENFTMPTAGEAGGLSTGTEAYYSFDYANVHFVVLNSTDILRAPSGAMMTWLAADVASTVQDWIIAYWHHPPYSKGSHDSDTEVPMFEMRQIALPILEDHGVDLVLTGHCHSYERSYFIDGYYGYSADWNESYMVDAGDGQVGGDGAYEKPQLGPDPHHGTIYAVTGNGGEIRGGDLDHPAMLVSLNMLGSMVLDIDGDQLDAKLLGSSGGILDQFTIVKAADQDSDDIVDKVDNCPEHSNPAQEDGDTDGIGDICDSCPVDPDNDIDSDGHCADLDNCPVHTNPGQEDGDSDGIGDPCDPCPVDPQNDIDSDGYCGNLDNCPLDPNPGQEDADSDGPGDACDECPNDPGDDIDSDAVCGDVDNCPNDYNPCQWDGDLNGVGDVCDLSSPEACNVQIDRDSWLQESSPNEPHGKDSEMSAKNGPGDNMRPVLHYDLLPIPASANVVSATAWLWVNSQDGSGLPVNVHRITAPWSESSANWNLLGGQFDTGVAGSFTPLEEDAWASVDITALVEDWIGGVEPNNGMMLIPTSPGIESKYATRDRTAPTIHPCVQVVLTCSSPDQDSDSDGVPDGSDGCPLDPDKIEPGICGCGVSDTDDDSDGYITCEDICPEDPDNDIDGDTYCANDDNCPTTANFLQTDADSDGTGDFCDPCPLDASDDADSDGFCADADNCPGSANPGQEDADSDDAGDSCDSCPQDPDNDMDGDLVCGDIDNCPGTSNPGQADSDSDGIGDACESTGDSDGDGIRSGQDNCPAVPNPLQQDYDGDGDGDACDSDDDDDGVLDGQDCARLAPGVWSDPGPIGDSLRFDKRSFTTLRWNRGLQGHVSHIYRGSISGAEPLPAAGCVDYENPDLESLQPENPASGEIFYYMVVAANVCSVSSPGEGSGSQPRSIAIICPAANGDADGDGVPNLEDNCAMVSNPDQADVDHDGIGDACDLSVG